METRIHDPIALVRGASLNRRAPKRYSSVSILTSMALDDFVFHPQIRDDGKESGSYAAT